MVSFSLKVLAANDSFQMLPLVPALVSFLPSSLDSLSPSPEAKTLWEPS